MNILITLAGTFALAFAATLVVALLLLLSGRKTKLLLMFSIAIGITIARASQYLWPISRTMYPLVLGLAVGLCTLIASHIGAHNSRGA